MKRGWRKIPYMKYCRHKNTTCQQEKIAVWNKEDTSIKTKSVYNIQVWGLSRAPHEVMSGLFVHSTTFLFYKMYHQISITYMSVFSPDPRHVSGDPPCELEISISGCSRSRSRFNFIVPLGKFVLGTVHHCFLNIPVHRIQKNKKHNHRHKHNQTNQHFNIENMELDRLKLPLAV